MADRITQHFAGIEFAGHRHSGIQIIDLLGELGARLADLPVPLPHLPLFAVADSEAVQSLKLATDSELLSPSVIKPGGGGGGATSGNDTLTGTSNNDTIDGLGGNDTISGLAGNDTLSGGDGNDTVSGGTGADTISGGLGDDILYSGAASPLLPSTPVLDRGTERDTITGGDGDDTIFAGYGDNVDGGANTLNGDKLYISFQGASSGVHFDAHLATQTIGGGTITGIEAISWVEGSNYDDYIDAGNDVFGAQSDFNQVYGMAGNDTLIAGYFTAVLDGGDGNDVLQGGGSGYLNTVNGGAGDDTINVGGALATVNGGDGNDVIYADYIIHGGAGDDIIHVVDSNWAATVTGDGGNDAIYGSITNENIDGGIGNDTIQGGGGDDVVTGGAGIDVIGGGLGSDTLTGGADSDTFLFGQADGKDLITDFTAGEHIHVNGYTSAQSITQVGSNVVITFSDADQLTVQNSTVAAVQAGLQFVPGTNDTLVGGSGDDYLNGYGGNDTISGNDGNDSLAGGAGADIIDGGAGGDTIYSDIYSVAPTYLISAASPPLLDRGSDVDTIRGGAGIDTIFAGYGDNVDGGEDIDTLYISFQGASSGVSFDLNLSTQLIGGGTITGIENAGWVEGSDFADTVNLNIGYTDGQSFIYGMGGDDTLIGGYETSVIDGGDGNDVVDARGSYYIARLEGGAGDDTIYTGINQVPVANGGDGNDTIYGSGEVNGGNGDDIIYAVDGWYSQTNPHVLSGDEGNDALHGSDLANLLDGGAGNDTIDAGAGDDTITGGAGDDLLTGGDGNDKFIVGEGNDVITDFAAGDSLIVEHAFAAQTVSQVGGDVVVALADGSQVTLQNTDVATVEAAMHFSEPHPNDVALSPDGSTLYATDDHGNLNVYNAESGVLIHSWHVGTDLGGMDVSPDGSFAIITELQPVATYPGPSQYDYPTFEVTVHKVDLTTGAVTDFNYHTSAFDYSFYDAAVLPDGNVLLTEYGYGGYSSGWGTMKLLNLSTGQFSGASGNVTSDSVLTRSGGLVFVGESDISDARVDVYTTGSGVTASHLNYADGVQGFNSGVQAINAQANLVAQSVSSSIYIYDTQLHYQLDIVQLHPELGGAAGLAFDATGKNLFVLSTSGEIYQVSTSDWSIVAEFPFDGSFEYAAGDFGNRLVVGPDSRYFMVVTDDGLVKIDNPNVSSTKNGTVHDDVLNGTGLHDTLNGLAGNDHIVAGAGDDLLNGGPGNDVLDGGAGVDTATYATSTAGVTVSLAIGGAQNTVGAGTDTLVGIENLTGSSYADTLTGDGNANLLTGAAGADTLVGGSGNDTLMGGSGADTLRGGVGDDVLAGGAGNDVYYVESAGDSVVENSGEGIDSVHSSIGWTLSANVEELLLTGTADVDGTGNELANTLTGNSGDNALYGLGGNDTLKGGAGDDAMAGGTGNDIYYVDSAGDSVIENAGEGTDTVNSSLSFTLGGNVERLVLTGASAIDGTGNELANMLTGNAADNHLYGLAGNDSLQGGGGSDWLEGGSGRDVFMGGAGADQFVFRDGDFAALTSSGCDTVNDFSSAEGDKLDFQFVDADSTAAGDQAFTFLGTAAFDGHAGELRYEVINGNTYVQGDTNGDGHVDFMVRVIGDHAFTSGDFTL